MTGKCQENGEGLPVELAAESGFSSTDVSGRADFCAPAPTPISARREARAGISLGKPGSGEALRERSPPPCPTPRLAATLLKDQRYLDSTRVLVYPV